MGDGSALNPNYNHSSSPVTVRDPSGATFTGADAIAAGNNHSAAVSNAGSTDETIYQWGNHLAVAAPAPPVNATVSPQLQAAINAAATPCTDCSFTEETTMTEAERQVRRLPSRRQRTAAARTGVVGQFGKSAS